MAKNIYLVYAQECNSDGTIDILSRKCVMYVFTNYKLAKNCAEYLNQKWQLGFKRNADFKKDYISYHFVEARTISKNDYSKL